MKKFIIGYIDTSGVHHVETYKTWNLDHAISLLKHPVKEVYSVETENISLSTKDCLRELVNKGYNYWLSL